MKRSPSCVMFVFLAGALCLPSVALAQAPTMTVACSSEAGERQHCPADTSAGVLLARETGHVACLLGRTWGYDATGVWVMDGCGGEFLVVGSAPDAVAAPVAGAPGGHSGAPHRVSRRRRGCRGRSGSKTQGTDAVYPDTMDFSIPAVDFLDRAE